MQSATRLAYRLVEHVPLQLLTNAVCPSLQLSVLARLHRPAPVLGLRQARTA